MRGGGCIKKFKNEKKISPTFETPVFVHSDVYPKNPAFILSDVRDFCVCPLRRFSTPTFGAPTFVVEPILILVFLSIFLNLDKGM